jgi:hypothetical protein
MSFRRSITFACPLAVALLCRPLLFGAESPFLYGIHDADPDPSEFLNHVKSGTGGTGGWVTATVAVGANTNDFSGANFTALANAGHTIICRINYGYFPDGATPVPAKYDDFAIRCKNFVANSTGCTIWLIGNESNLNAEWPFDSSNNRFNYISPASYALCFRKVYNAIKSVRPNDKVMPQALAPWGGPYGSTANLNGSGYPADGQPLNWVQYCYQMLTNIRASGPLDGIPLHIGSRGYTYTDIHSTSQVNAGGQNLYFSFYVYKDWIDYGIPPSLYGLPLYVTECNGLNYWKGGGPPGEDLSKHYEAGWMQEIYAEFNRYNQSAATNGRPIFRCVNFYRWCGFCDGWNIDGASNPYKTQILTDLDASVAYLYRWPTNVVSTNPPPAPSGLMAVVGNGKVTLAWNSAAFADTYRMKRATASGGPFSVIASNIMTTSYVNTSFTPGTTYYYRVSAVNTNGESPDSNIASATPTNGLSDVIVISAGWMPTNTILGGTSVVFRATIKNQGSVATPTSVSVPLGVGFSVSGGGNYTWATYTSPLPAGQSVTVIAGGGADGSNKWLATPGSHTLTVNADDIDRFPEALEDNNGFSTDFNVFSTTNAVNSGGGAVGNFAADDFVSGGYTFSVTNTIDASGVANAAPQAVYQSERWNNFTYAFPNLVPGAKYAVRLHFAEIFLNSAGLRLFHVSINGSQVLTNLDVFAEAGAKFRALVKQFNATADVAGNISVTFTQGAADWPKSSGIELNFVALPVNTLPVIASIPDQFVNANGAVSFTVSATDTNIPAQTLTYSLAPGAPLGSIINSTNGLFNWAAPVVTGALTNLVTVRVADNGSPPLTNSATFKMIIVPVPVASATATASNAVVVSWSTFPSKTYRLQFKDDLSATNWLTFGSDVIASGSLLSVTNSISGVLQRFYRVLQLN